jgi:hypothetical protein
MVKFDWYTKAILTIIATCLILLLLGRLPEQELTATVHAEDLASLNYTKDGGTGVGCSSDGKYVYVAGNEGIVKSEDYGRPGSWEKVLKED